MSGKSVVCPRCKTEFMKGTFPPYKNWIIKGRGDIKTRVNLYRCPKCGHGFRKGEQIK